MKAHMQITLAEMIEGLRFYLRQRTGLEPGHIEIMSYDQCRIDISEDNMVTCHEFRHSADQPDRSKK